jgi:hypothetical protein
LTHTGVEGFSHIQENRAGYPPLVVSVDSFNKAGQMQRLAVSGSKPKLLVTHQPTLVYFPEDPSEKDLFEELANSVK